MGSSLTSSPTLWLCTLTHVFSAADSLGLCNPTHPLHCSLLIVSLRLPRAIKPLTSMAGAGTVLALRAAVSPRTQAMAETNGGKSCRPLGGHGPLMAPPPGSQHPGILAAFQRRYHLWASRPILAARRSGGAPKLHRDDRVPPVGYKPGLPRPPAVSGLPHWAWGLARRCCDRGITPSRLTRD